MSVCSPGKRPRREQTLFAHATRVHSPSAAGSGVHWHVLCHRATDQPRLCQVGHPFCWSSTARRPTPMVAICKRFCAPKGSTSSAPSSFRRSTPMRSPTFGWWCWLDSAHQRPGNLINTYVAGGGRLVAMRPDTQLAPSLGITQLGSSTSEGYIRIDTSTASGAGFTTDDSAVPWRSKSLHPGERRDNDRAALQRAIDIDELPRRWCGTAPPRRGPMISRAA